MNRRLLIRALQKALQPAARRASRTRIGSAAMRGGLTDKEALIMGSVPAAAAPGIAWAAGNISPMSRATQMETNYMDAEDARMSELWSELERKRRGY